LHAADKTIKKNANSLVVGNRLNNLVRKKKNNGGRNNKRKNSYLSILAEDFQKNSRLIDTKRRLHNVPAVFIRYGNRP